MKVSLLKEEDQNIQLSEKVLLPIKDIYILGSRARRAIYPSAIPSSF